LSEQAGLPARFDWQLPSDLTSRREEVAGSTLVTPYRAFAIAVENETRAFAFYTSLCARADDREVRAQAERPAIEELRHTALMRRWRRQAWHRERGKRPAAPKIHDIPALHATLAAREAEIASSNRKLAARLRALGDEESGGLLEELRSVSSVPPVGARGTDDCANEFLPANPAHELAEESTHDPEPGDPVHLLVGAQRPVERLGEALEALRRMSEGPLFGEADKATASVVTRLARISLQIGERMEADLPAL
jgi:hypothetical protein